MRCSMGTIEKGANSVWPPHGKDGCDAVNKACCLLSAGLEV